MRSKTETDSGEEPAGLTTPAACAVFSPHRRNSPRSPGKWETFDTTLIGRRITVVQNGQAIIDDQEIPGITGGALDRHEELPWPIYLQGSEKWHAAYRSICTAPATK